MRGLPRGNGHRTRGQGTAVRAVVGTPGGGAQPVRSHPLPGLRRGGVVAGEGRRTLAGLGRGGVLAWEDGKTWLSIGSGVVLSGVGDIETE